MPQPPAYERLKDFTENFGSETDHSALNAELDKASNSINDIRDNLAILQADDGKLRPAVVTPDSISPELRSNLVEGVILDTQQLLLDAQAAGDEATAGANTAATKAAEAAAAAATATNKEKEATASATAAGNAATIASAKRDETIAARDAAVVAKDAALAAKDTAVGASNTSVLARDEALASANTAAAKRDETVAARDIAITKRDEAIAARDTAVAKANEATNKAAEAAASAASVDATKQVPAGMVGYFPRKTPLPGWLKANGAAGISRLVYVDLDAAIYCGDAENATAASGYRYTDPANPSGSRSITGEFIMIDDLRGEFPRGWDDGRGVDAGRQLRSAQAQGIQSHQHPLGLSTSSDFYTDYGATRLYTVKSSGSYLNGMSNSLGGATGGAETRPRNVALLACIKY